MLQSPLERVRAGMEDIDTFEMLIVRELEVNQKQSCSHRRKLASEHRIVKALHEIRERAKEIKKNNELLDAEIKQFRGGGSGVGAGGKTTVEFFLDNLRKLEAYAHEHRETFERTRLDPLIISRSLIQPQIEDIEFESNKNHRLREDEVILNNLGFNGEEHNGRFFDLQEFYQTFQNLTESSNVSYLDYVKIAILQFELIPKTMGGFAYLTGLYEYLTAFEKKTKPLQYFKFHEEESADDLSDELDDALTPSDLEKYGADALKNALKVRGLKFGGTLQQRCERLFLVKGLNPNEYPQELKQAINGGAAGSTAAGGKNASNVAYSDNVRMEMESKIKSLLLDRMSDVVESTEQMIIKKLTMTYEEVMREFQKQDDEEDEEEEDEDKAENNRNQSDADDDIKVPTVGFAHPVTGKIIPKWMYRMQGLNQVFKCEVCGGAPYFGRINYLQHFKDYKHSNGMKALGVPNTSHFYQISKISEVLSIWEKLKGKLDSGEKMEDIVEYEDSEGNVLSKKEMDDLKREGLL